MKTLIAMVLLVQCAMSSSLFAQAVDSTSVVPAGAGDGNTVVAAEPAVLPPLRVATKIAEPFVIQREDGSLEGISIALWKRVARQLNREYTFEVMTLDELLAGVTDGTYDAGIAAISVTPEREAALDMSHGYIMSGLGIATRPSTSATSFLGGFINLFTWAFLSAAGALCVILLVVGVVIWFVERRRNPDQFGGGVVRGIGSGFWFSAVTMTTVGYGDKAPQTPVGRIIAFVWMFASIIVISAFTGAIASSLTAAQFVTVIRSPEDLRTARVGAVEGAASVAALKSRGVFARPYATVDDGLRAVVNDEIDAFVHDRPLLQWWVSQEYAGELTIPAAQFDMTSYAIALPNDSPLREGVNRAVLSITRDREWSEVLDMYMAGPH